MNPANPLVRVVGIAAGGFCGFVICLAFLGWMLGGKR